MSEDREVLGAPGGAGSEEAREEEEGAEERAVGRVVRKPLHGGSLSRRAIDKAFDEDAPVDFEGPVSPAVASAVAAAILDQMQNVPHMLDYVAKADARLFDLDEVDLLPDNDLFDRRQAAMKTVKDIKTWALKLLQTLQPYLENEEDDDVRKFMSYVKMLDKGTLKTIIASCERQMSAR